jgi:hypothetical protein
LFPVFGAGTLSTWEALAPTTETVTSQTSECGDEVIPSQNHGSVASELHYFN